MKHFAKRLHKEMIQSEKAFNFRFVYILHCLISRTQIRQSQCDNSAHFRKPCMVIPLRKIRSLNQYHPKDAEQYN
jgi:hypothetical protein